MSLRSSFLLTACVLAVPALSSCSRSSYNDAGLARAADGSCDADGWAHNVADLGQRAARGESIVSTEGCSLFDGKLLARGFPQTVEEARKALRLDATCQPKVNAAGSEVTFGETAGRLLVMRVRNLTDEELAAQEKQAGPSLQTVLLRAARCPRADRRLKEDKDASLALTYALATDALQKALVATDGTSSGPEADTAEALDRVCTAAGKPAALDVKEGAGATGVLTDTIAGKLDPEPFAAMALIMASSFTVFGEAARTFKVADPSIELVRPSAREVLAHPPKSNIEGACALWTMARGVMDAQKTVAKKGPAKKKMPVTKTKKR